MILDQKENVYLFVWLEFLFGLGIICSIYQGILEFRLSREPFWENLQGLPLRLHQHYDAPVLWLSLDLAVCKIGYTLPYIFDTTVGSGH